MPDSKAARPKTSPSGTTVRWAGIDWISCTNQGDSAGSAWILRIEHADCVHQLLLGDRRVIDLTRRYDSVENVRRAALKLIDVDTGIEE